MIKRKNATRQGTNKEKKRKRDRKRRKDSGKPSQKNERKAESAAEVEEKGEWIREEDGKGVYPWFTRGSYWVGGWKKTGKQVIRSTRLSIEVGVGGTWREWTTPYQYPSLSSLFSRPTYLSTSLLACVFSRRMRLLLERTPLLRYYYHRWYIIANAVAIAVATAATITSQFAASKFKHRLIFLASSVSFRSTSTVHLFPCSRDHLWSWLWYLMWFFHTQSRPFYFVFLHCPFTSSPYGIYFTWKEKQNVIKSNSFMMKLFTFSFSL